MKKYISITSLISNLIIANNKTLNSLIIGTLNNLDEDSLQALSRNNTLTGLRLYYRNIGAKEIATIAKIASLKYFGIGYDEVGDDAQLDWQRIHNLKPSN